MTLCVPLLTCVLTLSQELTHRFRVSDFSFARKLRYTKFCLMHHREHGVGVGYRTFECPASSEDAVPRHEPSRCVYWTCLKVAGAIWSRWRAVHSGGASACAEVLLGRFAVFMGRLDDSSPLTCVARAPRATNSTPVTSSECEFPDL